MQVAVRCWDEIWTISVHKFEEVTTPKWEWLLRTVAVGVTSGDKEDMR